MRTVQEEIFGPVITIIDYDTVDEAVQIANDSPFGLSGAVFGTDKAAAVAVARRLRAGRPHRQQRNRLRLRAPYGGFKLSGTGRELGGVEGILSFTEQRAIGI
ncbi:aldehyde dehydrogenase family protein [Lentzea sp. JNUCC 0626]|uniref:aldehyde dehydrogenase family protein n=1 Tax=Lentzea sp. JNUCC 0626 TaxID=3367513 RepID=UPI00374A5DE2